MNDFLFRFRTLVRGIRDAIAASLHPVCIAYRVYSGQTQLVPLRPYRPRADPLYVCAVAFQQN